MFVKWQTLCYVCIKRKEPISEDHLLYNSICIKSQVGKSVESGGVPVYD